MANAHIARDEVKAERKAAVLYSHRTCYKILFAKLIHGDVVKKCCQASLKANLKPNKVHIP